MPNRYLIVGMGAAGLAAAEAIRSHDPAGDIALVSEDAHGYYSRPGLAYYLTGEIPERMLYPFGDEDYRRLKVRLVRARVVRLEPDAHRVEVEGGESLPYDRLLLATGSQATEPPVPGRELQGVVKLDDLEDARSILRLGRRARAAVVVGGGITALEIAEGLHARHVHTHYFLRRGRYWAGVLDEAESRIVEHRLQHEGVEIHYQTELAQIVGKRGRVSGVVTEDGGEIPCGLVAIAIGVRPRVELAVGAGLKTERGVVVNEYLQTSAPDVFAAGDVAQVFDPLSGRAVLNTLWSVAVAQGRAAGRNMMGRAEVYHKAVSFNVTRLAWLTTTVIGTVGRGREDDAAGLSRGESETWRQGAGPAKGEGSMAIQGDAGGNRVRILVGGHALLGAIVMGDQALSRPLYDLIAHQADVTPIHDRLLQPAANLGELVTDFWSEWRRGHAAQES